MPAISETPVAQPASLVAGSPEREPNLARFGLRHLFFYFSVATILCAALARIGGVWPIVIGSVVALIAAHVFGTFLGTRLRDTSDEVQRWKGRPGSLDRDEPIALPQPVSKADLPSTAALPLASHDRIHRWSNLCVAAGILLGAGLGATAIYAIAGDHVTWFGVALGSVSCGVLGAWAALLATNFWMISRHALRHATKEQSRH